VRKRRQETGVRSHEGAAAAWILTSVFCLLTPCFAQDFSQRGFLETGVFLFPQTAPNDSGRAIGESLLRYEAFYKLFAGLELEGGIDAYFDTHGESDREIGLSFWDRGTRRPSFAVRRLSASYHHGKLSLEAGKQFIRWGKTDILAPTDRFAPRDFLNVVDADYLAVTAARATYGTQANTIDVVFEPRLTPSRVPLLNQRWAVLPAGIPFTDEAPVFPGGPQFGARWNHIGVRAEYSFSFYNGDDNLPLYRAVLRPAAVGLRRFYPQMRMYGADAALPLRWLTVKAEAGYFTSTTPEADHYALYVLQLERQAGEWSFVAGYAGQAVVQHGTAIAYSPERGLARSLVGRAAYTVDTNRSVEIETVVRENGAGFYVKPAWSQALGQHWRVTAGFALIRGRGGDFLGQYHRNSFAVLTARYSF